MSRQRQKGTAYETYLLDDLRYIFGNQVDRAPLRGTQDRGDFDHARIWDYPMVIEAKKRNRWDLPKWIRQTQAKAEDYWMIVFAGDKRTDLADDYVVMPMYVLRGMLETAYEMGHKGNGDLVR